MIGSVAEMGQQVPVVVIRDAERYVLIDGYLRRGVASAASRHGDGDDVVSSEVEALLHHRHLELAKRAALEDAWLLGRLREHGLTVQALARERLRLS